MAITNLQLGKPFKYHRMGTIARIIAVHDIYRLPTNADMGVTSVQWFRQLIVQDLASRSGFPVPVIGQATLELGLGVPVPTTLQARVYHALPGRLCQLDSTPGGLVFGEAGDMLSLPLPPSSDHEPSQ